jgi:hypothetical protein
MRIGLTLQVRIITKDYVETVSINITITRGSIIADTAFLRFRNACQTSTPEEVVLVDLPFDLLHVVHR